MEGVKTEEIDAMSSTIDDHWLQKWTEVEDLKDECDAEVKREFKAEGDHEGNDDIEAAAKDVPYNSNDSCTGKNLEHNSHVATQSEKLTKVQKINLKVRRLCNNATKSATFSNMCTYKCLECSDQLKEWSSLRRHYNIKHNKKLKSLSLLQIDKLVEKATSYYCKICSEVLLCDDVFLKRHLKKHNLLIHQYLYQYERDIPLSYSNKVIGNLCVLKCYSCHYQFRDKYTLAQHYKKSLRCKEMHDEATSMIKVVYHTCHVCQMFLLCMSIVLRDHFKNRHNLNFEEYCAKTGCVIDANWGLRLGYAKSDVQDATNSQVNRAMNTDAYISACRHDSDIFLYFGKSVQELCQGARSSESLSNLCKFSCHECDEIKSGWRNFKKHQATKHGIKIFL